MLRLVLRKEAEEAETVNFPWYPPTIDPRNVTLRDRAAQTSEEDRTTEEGSTSDEKTLQSIIRSNLCRTKITY